MTAIGKTVPNPRENLQIMLLEACQRVLSQIVPATPTLILESKLPKKLPKNLFNLKNLMSEIGEEKWVQLHLQLKRIQKEEKGYTKSSYSGP